MQDLKVFLLGENSEYDFAFKNLYKLELNLDYYFFSKTYGILIYIIPNNVQMREAVGKLVCRKKSAVFDNLAEYTEIKKNNSNDVKN